MSAFQLGSGPGQIFELDGSGQKQIVASPQEAKAAPSPEKSNVLKLREEPEPLPAKKTGTVSDEPAIKPRSFRAELKARRKDVQREVNRLRRFETELLEIDRMLAALPNTRAPKSR